MDLRAWILAEYGWLDFLYKTTAGFVPRERWSERPYPSSSPVSFHVWHLARWEDVFVNVFLLDRGAVYSDGWSAKFGVGPAPGTGFTNKDVDRLTSAISPDVLDEYWIQVQSRTRSWIDTVPDAEMDAVFTRVIDIDDALVRAGDVLPEASLPGAKDWHRGRTGDDWLRRSVILHAVTHFGEIETVRHALDYKQESD